jgi:hypothetical protein
VVGSDALRLEELAAGKALADGDIDLAVRCLTDSAQLIARFSGMFDDPPPLNTPTYCSRPPRRTRRTARSPDSRWPPRKPHSESVDHLIVNLREVVEPADAKWRDLTGNR